MIQFQKYLSLLKIAVISIMAIFAFYSIVVEPSIIVTENVHIPVGINKKIVFISDIHLGIYKGGDFLEKTVEIINRNNPDYVLIAGDLTLFLEKPSHEELVSYFLPFKKIKAPTYAIFGNHDLRHPGPDIAFDLKNVLENLGIHVLNNDNVKLDGFTLIGLGEWWSNDTDISLLRTEKNLSKTIALIHNPDILTLYDKDTIPALTLAGHVHGGQVRIPWLYKFFIPSKGNYERGYYEEEIIPHKKARLFISQGLGETGLPARFLCPPTLYVFDLK